jgi:hypothetical protein
LKPGDSVRMSAGKNVFRKGYVGGWTDEIFRVKSCQTTTPVTYEEVDAVGEVLKGRFYGEELQKVDELEEYVVEKVLKTRRRAGRIEYFVKWKNYPSTTNSWVDDVKRLAQ